MSFRKKVFLGIFAVVWLVICRGFSQADEEGSKIMADIVAGYNSNLAKIESGSCTETVTSTSSLPEGKTNHYKALHTLKFIGPYLRWEHSDSRNVTSPDGKVAEEIKGFAYDTYIDKEKGICYGYMGENRYEIRNIEQPQPTGNPKLYRIMPQDYGKPRYLEAKELTNRFIKYEDFNGHRCALIEGKRVEEKTTTIVHSWIDTESCLVLKEEIWIRDNTSGKEMPLYKSDLQITLCDKESNLFGPKVFKETQYKFLDPTTGKSEIQSEETVTFENLTYNVNIDKNDLIMVFPKGAEVKDYMVGGTGYTVK